MTITLDVPETSEVFAKHPRNTVEGAETSEV